jgi:predicted ester cyclase
MGDPGLEPGTSSLSGEGGLFALTCGLLRFGPSQTIAAPVQFTPDEILRTMPDTAETARYAIEEVCSGRRLEDLEKCYSPTFVDHVNSMEFHGYEGARQSVALYQRLFEDLRFETEQQVATGDRVATHWTLTGTYRGRQVKFSGITISRFEDGRIAEDWGYSDTVEIAKQLGVWRTLLVIGQEWRFLLGRD